MPASQNLEMLQLRSDDYFAEQRPRLPGLTSSPAHRPRNKLVIISLMVSPQERRRRTRLATRSRLPFRRSRRDSFRRRHRPSANGGSLSMTISATAWSAVPEPISLLAPAMRWREEDFPRSIAFTRLQKESAIVQDISAHLARDASSGVRIPRHTACRHFLAGFHRDIDIGRYFSTAITSTNSDMTRVRQGDDDSASAAEGSRRHTPLIGRRAARRHGACARGNRCCRRTVDGPHDSAVPAYFSPPLPRHCGVLSRHRVDSKASG